MALGRSAKVLASTGRHSGKFVGQVGVAVQSIDGGKFWVLRFPSVLPVLIEGLFHYNEVEWSK